MVRLRRWLTTWCHDRFAGSAGAVLLEVVALTQGQRSWHSQQSPPDQGLWHGLALVGLGPCACTMCWVLWHLVIPGRFLTFKSIKRDGRMVKWKW